MNEKLRGIIVLPNYEDRECKKETESQMKSNKQKKLTEDKPKQKKKRKRIPRENYDLSKFELITTRNKK